MCAKHSCRRSVITLVTALALAWAPILVTQQAMAQNEGYASCLMDDPANTPPNNDTSQCVKNSQGAAGCTGSILVYATAWSCDDEYPIGWCAEDEPVPQATSFTPITQVTPENIANGIAAQLLGLTLTGVCYVAVVAFIAGTGGVIPPVDVFALGVGGACTAGEIALIWAAFNPCFWTTCVQGPLGQPIGQMYDCVP